MVKLKHLPKLLIAFGLLSINNSFAEQVHIFRIGQGDSILEYQISLPKDTFLLHERIYTQMWAKNISSIPLKYMPSRLFDYWNITDHKGKEYKPPTLSHRGMRRDTLQPGDSAGGIRSFTSYGVFDTLNYTIPRIFPKGKYSALYPSDTVPFIFFVVDPGGEDTEALKQYLDAFCRAPLKIWTGINA